MTATCRIIEARWNEFADSERTQDFFDIESGCYTLEEAKAIAAHFARQRAQLGPITWLDGVPDKHGNVYYAHVTPALTLRIRG